MTQPQSDQELDLSELQDSPEAVKVAAHLPKPLVVRTVLVTAATLLGALMGKDLNVAWLNPVLDAYIIGAPVAIGWWFHRKTKGVVAATKEAVLEVESHVGKHEAP